MLFRLDYAFEADYAKNYASIMYQCLLMCNFSIFGAALLFKCGFYLRTAYMQSPEFAIAKSVKRSGTCKMKVKLDMEYVLKIFQM